LIASTVYRRLASVRNAKPLLLLVTAPLLVTALLSGCATANAPAPASSVPGPTTPAATDHTFARLEQEFDARLGVYVLDTATGRTVTYRADDRFAYASTYKVLIAGVLLRRDSDADLAHLVTYTTADLRSYSPITSNHTTTGMTVSDLIAAALRYSDNTAANLLLNQLGGPGGLRAALRRLGDTTTYVDRNEPTVNTAIPGDSRDTSTPRVLGTDLRGFVLGDLLPAARRELLAKWLLGNTTGTRYVEAGVPSGWRVGDKTGNADYGTRNDIAIAWPPTGSPVVIALQSDRNNARANSADGLLADATRAALAELR
jgi:beta-lactamase class A